jgi:hypothetical protein
VDNAAGRYLPDVLGELGTGRHGRASEAREPAPQAGSGAQPGAPDGIGPGPIRGEMPLAGHRQRGYLPASCARSRVPATQEILAPLTRRCPSARRPLVGRVTQRRTDGRPAEMNPYYRYQLHQAQRTKTAPRSSPATHGSDARRRSFVAVAHSRQVQHTWHHGPERDQGHNGSGHGPRMTVTVSAHRPLAARHAGPLTTASRIGQREGG